MFCTFFSSQFISHIIIRLCYFRIRYVIKHCQAQPYFIKYRIWYFKKGLWNFLIYSACGIESSVLESFPKNILFWYWYVKIVICLISPCLLARLSLLCLVISLQIWAFKEILFCFLIDIILKNWQNAAQQN